MEASQTTISNRCFLQNHIVCASYIYIYIYVVGIWIYICVFMCMSIYIAKCYLNTSSTQGNICDVSWCSNDHIYLSSHTKLFYQGQLLKFSLNSRKHLHRYHFCWLLWKAEIYGSGCQDKKIKTMVPEIFGVVVILYKTLIVLFLRDFRKPITGTHQSNRAGV